MSWINAARKVVETKTASRIDIVTGHLVPDGRHRKGKVVLLDLYSASVMTQVYDNLGSKAQEKFDRLDVVNAQDIAFSLLEKLREM